METVVRFSFSFSFSFSFAVVIAVAVAVKGKDVVRMVKLIKSFRLNDDEISFIEGLAKRYSTSEASVLRTILSIFIRDAVRREELEEELKQKAIKTIEKKALKEIRDEGKRSLRKATFRVRMIKFYSQLIKDGVRWSEFKDTFTSWYNEAKLLNIDENVVKDTVEKIAFIYYQTRNDIDMEEGLKDVYATFVEEVKADGNNKEEKVGIPL